MIKPGIYRHSKKGNEYRVIGTGKHTETLESMVVYEALYDNKESKIWVRPEEMFQEIVEVNGAKVPRFVFVRAE
ncbi:MAG TPA: DUF1653 domain-containing protein [Candidatus Paceibacterota bacterium]